MNKKVILYRHSPKYCASCLYFGEIEGKIDCALHKNISTTPHTYCNSYAHLNIAWKEMKRKSAFKKLLFSIKESVRYSFCHLKYIIKNKNK